MAWKNEGNGGLGSVSAAKTVTTEELEQAT
jgi:hypothetical protein